MSDETCSGFDPEAIAKAAEPKPSVSWVGMKELPRPAVPERVADVAGELDDLIRWTAELCRPGPCWSPLVRQRLSDALGDLGAARALLIAEGL